MAYPAYDTYNTQLAYPQRHSMYGQQYGAPYGDYAYTEPPLAAGVYGDNYPQPSYPIYAPQRTVSQYHPGRAYDDLDIRDSYYPMDRQYSTAGYATPYAPALRHRRHSSLSRRSRMHLDGYRRIGSTLVKFKRKGGLRTGVTLGEAMSNVHLSGNESFSFYDLNADHRGKIVLKIRWTGYTSMTYELPVDDYDGRVELQTLARRVARACVHFIQANMIPISWDRVILYHLEEISIGTWQPILSSS
ncbi:hypothetical protein AcW1_004587 [Taiwanofungus camphoratus]|nr:hypothetical protein AcW2_006408 [Antrodia cinnamomea]KAI0959903.1 hypothetical protein AcW1_004587 [Antrodia cinnamomea]